MTPTTTSEKVQLAVKEMSEKVPGKVIYIGSIPYDQTEEQVLGMCFQFRSEAMETNNI